VTYHRTLVSIAGVAAVAIGVYAEIGFSGDDLSALPGNDPRTVAVEKGLRWLVSVQGKDGGWGQDGGETSYVRQGENLESLGNDVANTAVAAEALLHTGNTPTRGAYRESLGRAVDFILRNVEQSPTEGLAVTSQVHTQIQRKLGPYIDTFLTSKLLAELDGAMGNAQANARVRRNLEKCVAKIERNQLKDGSWNVAGGWAPILGTSMASQSLFVAQSKGVAVQTATMDRVEQYSKLQQAPQQAGMGGPGAGSGSGSGGGYGSGPVGRIGPARTAVTVSAPASTVMVDGAAAGVPLYRSAQQLEQLSRTEKDRKENAPAIRAITAQLSDARFVTGFGSIGGEEFFSWLNISDSLRRTGGAEWKKWNADIQAKILTLQNADGTWAGHHCITGRVAVTGAAILALMADREPAFVGTKAGTN
jgi:hypothetical protein